MVIWEISIIKWMIGGTPICGNHQMCLFSSLGRHFVSSKEMEGGKAANEKDGQNYPSCTRDVPLPKQ